MKVLPFTIPKPKKDALIVQEDKQASFYDTLHQHEEIQLSWIRQGEGSLLVGDTVNHYSTNDVIILGGNIPHVFKSDPRKDQDSHMLTVFFTKDSFGTHFFVTEELRSLQSFFKKATHGFRITKPSDKVRSIFLAVEKTQKIDRFLYFMQLLKTLNSARYERLSSYISEKKFNEVEGKRLNAVFAYTLQHFKEAISLQRIAMEATMTPNAFCKYFKKHTRKTYGQFLNELRIEAASKALIDFPESSITDIAETNGFQNLSNFNRRFKKEKGCTPSELRKSIS